MLRLTLIVVFFLFSTQTIALKSNNFVSKHFDDKEDDLIKRMGLITYQTEKFSKTIPKDLSQDFFCQQCLDISHEARRIFFDTHLLDQVSMLANEVCLHDVFDLGMKCLPMAEKYASQTITFLQILLFTEDVCNNTWFCPNSTISSTHSTMSIKELSRTITRGTQKKLPKEITCKLLDGTDYFMLEKILAELGETRICSACRVILYKIRIALKNPMTQAIIVKVLLRACTMTNRKYMRKCKRMVAEYGPLSVTLISRFMNVVDLCNLSHFCQVIGPMEREIYTSLHKDGEYSVCTLLKRTMEVE